MSYQVPADVSESELLVKKSRFIARIVPVGDRAAVNAAVAQARSDYPDARHHCWAYLLGRPEDAASAGMSDDGEPAGTAGKPILNVLQHGELGDVLIIVIRYFGGIKLGAGGLVRAYSAAARQVLEQAPVRTLRQLSNWQLRGDFSCEQPLRHFLATVQGELRDPEYTDGFCCIVDVPAEQVEALQSFCASQQMILSELV